MGHFARTWNRFDEWSGRFTHCPITGSSSVYMVIYVGQLCLCVDSMNGQGVSRDHEVFRRNSGPA